MASPTTGVDPMSTIVWAEPTFPTTSSPATAAASNSGASQLPNWSVIVVATAICGGLFLLALLIWTLKKRSQQRRVPSKPKDVARRSLSIRTLRSRRRKAESITALPLYTNESRHALISDPSSTSNSPSKTMVHTTTSTPLFPQPHADTDAHSTHASTLNSTLGSTISSALSSTSATLSTANLQALAMKITKPRPARLDLRPTPREQIDRRRSNPTLGLASPWLDIPHSTQRRPRSISTIDDALAGTPTSPEISSPCSSSRSATWSWTNSQAPATPRIAMPNQHASILLVGSSSSSPTKPLPSRWSLYSDRSPTTARHNSRRYSGSSLRMHPSVASRSSAPHDRIDEDPLAEEAQDLYSPPLASPSWSYRRFR